MQLIRQYVIRSGAQPDVCLGDGRNIGKTNIIKPECNWLIDLGHPYSINGSEYRTKKPPALAFRSPNNGANT